MFGAGVFKTEPLKRLIARYVDEAMLERIAAEYRKGRRLLVVTTNLDAQRTAVWDMGAIAASGAPGALALFRDVLVASASVPGVYSPVLINVEGEGRRFDEMHVDGGVRANLLVVPESLLLSSVPPPASGVHPRVYIVMNDKLEQDFEVVEGKALTIVARSFTTAVKANTQNTLIATYDFARRNKWDFNLASIDGDYPTTTSLGFDRTYMRHSTNMATSRLAPARPGARPCRPPIRAKPDSRARAGTTHRVALDRPLALHGDARARARVRPVIPHRAMLGAAIVPERDRVLAPAEAALEQRVLGSAGRDSAGSRRSRRAGCR